MIPAGIQVQVMTDTATASGNQAEDKFMSHLMNYVWQSMMARPVRVVCGFLLKIVLEMTKSLFGNLVLASV